MRLLLTLCVAVIATVCLSQQQMLLGGRATVASWGGAPAAAVVNCPGTNTTPQISQLNNAAYQAVGNADYYYYVGVLWTNIPTATNICSVGAILYCEGGNMATNTVYAEVWQVNENMWLTNLLGSTGITGLNPQYNPTWTNWTFSNSISVTNSNIAIMFTMNKIAADGSFPYLARDSANDIVPFNSIWRYSNGTPGDTYDLDIAIKLWMK